MIAMTTEPTAQFHSSVAVDSQDRVWVAWDEADQNWGKDFSQVSAAPGSRGLHYSRKIGMRVYANGRVQAPSADLSEILDGRATRFAELPHLSFDSSGALWMVFRHWTLSQPQRDLPFLCHAAVAATSGPCRCVSARVPDTTRSTHRWHCRRTAGSRSATRATAVRRPYFQRTRRMRCTTTSMCRS